MNEKIRKMFCNPTSNSFKIFLYLATHQQEAFLYKSTLSRLLKIKYTTLNYWITKFQQEGLIERNFKLTAVGNKIFEFIWNGKDINLLRAHNIQLKFILSACPVNYVEKYSDKIFTEFTNKRFRGLRGEIMLDWGKITIMIYSRKKIICVLNDIFGETDEEISGTLCLILPSITSLIEKRFPGIKISNCIPARIQTSHIAYLNSTLAKKFRIKGFTYEGEDLAVDGSNGDNETETTNPKTNLRGIELVKEIESKIKEGFEV